MIALKLLKSFFCSLKHILYLDPVNCMTNHICLDKTFKCHLIDSDAILLLDKSWNIPLPIYFFVMGL